MDFEKLYDLQSKVDPTQLQKILEEVFGKKIVITDQEVLQQTLPEAEEWQDGQEYPDDIDAGECSSTTVVSGPTDAELCAAAADAERTVETTTISIEEGSQWRDSDGDKKRGDEKESEEEEDETEEDETSNYESEKRPYAVKMFRHQQKVDLANCQCYGYVMDEEMIDVFNKNWKGVRSGKHTSVKAMAVSLHENAPCGRFCNEARTHWHILVWFDSPKPTDTAFHRNISVKAQQKFKNWMGEIIRVPDSMMKYIQVEPRVLEVVYGNAEFIGLMDKAWDEREVMAKKIDVRDEKQKGKEAKGGVKRKWKEDDWWQANEYNPHTLSQFIQEHGCRDVASFLNYAKSRPICRWFRVLYLFICAVLV